MTKRVYIPSNLHPIIQERIDRFKQSEARRTAAAVGKKPEPKVDEEKSA